MMFFKDLENIMEHYTKSGGFLTCSAEGKTNTMTVSWGFIGFFWKKPLFIVGVRPQRFTKGIMDMTDSFTISIPYNKMNHELNECGTKSGRTVDKSEIVNFVKGKTQNSYVVQGCDVYFECKIMTTSNFQNYDLPEDILEKFYKKNDFHELYIGEIIERY